MDPRGSIIYPRVAVDLRITGRFKIATIFQGAFCGLVVGFITGVSRMILAFVYEEPSCGQEDKRPIVVSSVHYMYFAMILFRLTAIVTVLASLLTKPPEGFRVQSHITQRFVNAHFNPVLK